MGRCPSLDRAVLGSAPEVFRRGQPALATTGAPGARDHCRATGPRVYKSSRNPRPLQGNRPPCLQKFLQETGRVPRLLLEQVLEQQIEDGHAREHSDLHGKKGKPQERNGTRNTHEENCRLSDVDQGSVMSPIVRLVESLAFETLGGIPQLTGRQIGVFENVSSHQPSSCQPSPRPGPEPSVPLSWPERLTKRGSWTLVKQVQQKDVSRALLALPCP